MITEAGLGDPPRYSLQDIFDVLASSVCFEEVLDRILAVTLRELQAEQGSLLLLVDDDDEEEQRLKMIASSGLPPTMIERGYVSRTGSISEYVLRERRPLILHGPTDAIDYSAYTGNGVEERLVYSAICVPLITRGTVIGTMNINRTRTHRRFSDADLEAASIIGGQAALVIEHRRLKDELLKQERLAAVGLAVANVSHCLKNILTGLWGGLDLAAMGVSNGKQELSLQGLDMLRRNATLAGNLVLDLLDYSKKREPAREKFDLNRVIQHAIEVVQYQAGEEQVMIEMEVPEQLMLFGDRDQIYRGLVNLLGNAVDACSEMEGKRLVRISAGSRHRDELGTLAATRTQPRWVMIEVEDNGVGIPEDQIDQIWDLFYSTKGSRGTGIGLPATRKMVEEHGGKVRVSSIAGQGTTFTLLLPSCNPD